MTKYTKNKFRQAVSLTLVALFCAISVFPASAALSYSSDFTTTTTSTKVEGTTDVELSKLQEQYDKLEEKISEGDKLLQDVESGKKKQSDNIKIIKSNLNDLNDQISVLEERVGVLNTDINTLNSSISGLNQQISKLNTEISDTEDMIYKTTGTTDILFGKIRGRLMINYMSGEGSTLAILLGVTDLPGLLTKLQIIHNLDTYDQKILKEFEENLETLNNLNDLLDADKSALNEKMGKLTGDKNTLASRQSDMEASQYVLDLKKELSQHKYDDAVKYFQTLDETSDDYNAMLKLLSDEQDKVDAEINAYLLKYGSSADGNKTESVTEASGDGTTISTTKKSNGSGGLTSPAAHTGTASSTAANGGNASSTGEITFPTTSSAPKVNPESIALIWPVPYSNCYISANYGQYPSGGEHHGTDICVRGGSEGKNVVAAAGGTVISYGFNHWSMGNYVIIDHGAGLFTAYYHMQKLFVQKGDYVQQGQVIGLIGHTGNTTGPHLHFEVRVSRNGVITRMNPMKFVKLPA